MANIPEKTLEDLEYLEVLRQCADFAITSIGKEVILALKPINDDLLVLNNLQMTV
jgi:dsDNA-specific endonuclease/ATPase MutS2